MTEKLYKQSIRKLSSKTLGILGGGQLGKMIGMSASKLGIKVCIFAPSEESPAFQIADNVFISEYTDKKSLKEFAKRCDAITYEFENIPLQSLEYISNFTNIYPGLLPLQISQDRLLEKNFISNLRIAVTDYSEVKSKKDIKNFLLRTKSSKCILKTTRQGYDGKGQKRIDLKKLENTNISFKNNKYIVEKFIKLKKEISIIVVRRKNGSTVCFNPSENKHLEGILRETSYPAKISKKIQSTAKRVSIKIAEALNIVGIIAVEMFITDANNLLVNEVAPRPHNSGHWTIDACNISQFDALVRTIFELPIPEFKYSNKCKMINILGDNYGQIDQSLNKINHKVHIYGKRNIKSKRKMGHVNILQ